MTNNTLLRTTAAALFTAGLAISFSATAEENEIVDRVKPVGQLVIKTESAPVAEASSTEATTESAPATANSGKATYDASCFACHGTGAAGAPILGKKDAWEARISQGNETLYDHAINGFNAMPAKGGNTALSDDDIKAVVDYMVEQSS